MERNIGGIASLPIEKEEFELRTEEGEKTWFDDSIGLDEFIAHSTLNGNAKSLCNNNWIMRTPTKGHYYLVAFNGTDLGREIFDVRVIRRGGNFISMLPLAIPKKFLAVASH